MANPPSFSLWSINSVYVMTAPNLALPRAGQIDMLDF